MSRLRKKINTLLLQYQNKWNSMWLLIKWNLHSIVFETIKRNKHWSIAIKMHNNLNSSWKASYLGLFLLQGLIILILLKKRTNNDSEIQLHGTCLCHTNIAKDVIVVLRSMVSWGLVRCPVCYCVDHFQILQIFLALH